jgi:NADH-quinone oxidoreductase subunit E
MTVRRLAEAELQPASFAFNEANEAAAKRWIAKYPRGREASAIIPLMMLAQEQEGWVTRAAIEAIADRLGMPYIRALEVATFYTQYQLKPVGARAHVQVCGTTPCMLRGSEALMDVCREKIHAEPHHVNADGTLSWEEVECLGACVNAPMVMIFKDTYEDLTPQRLAEIIDQFAAGKGGDVPVGPQNGRIVSAPPSGLTSLTSEYAVLKETRDRETGGAEEPAAETPSIEEDAGAQPAAVPPSRAGRPKTYAPETSPVLDTPSPEKVPARDERAASADTTSHDANAANRSDEAVEGVSRQRKSADRRKGENEELESPELLRGEPIGASGKQTAAPKPSLEDERRPAGIDRPAEPDDLKLISGVGPKIEGILHSLGIFTFAQIASWTEGEREWVDTYLNFRGRIERDQWVRQAEALARGGVAEYVRVFGKEPR